MALMGIALLATVWSTYRGVHDASQTLMRGQADVFRNGIRVLMADLKETAVDKDAALATILDEYAGDGLRYVAVFGRDGQVIAWAGEPRGSATDLGTAATMGEPVEVGDRVRVVSRGPHKLRSHRRPRWSRPARCSSSPSRWCAGSCAAQRSIGSSSRSDGWPAWGRCLRSWPTRSATRSRRSRATRSSSRGRSRRASSRARRPIAWSSTAAMLTVPALALAERPYRDMSPACVAKRAEKHAAYDANGDGALDREARQLMRRERMAERFQRLDTNRDDAISRAEAEGACSRLSRHFDAVDADSDGFITKAEMRAARAHMHRRGRHGKRHGHGAQQ